ncbi:PTS sugar transporter subunit IIB [Clostridium massiliamazoniense]|uniref:PTS sugar transporter subunit IIB n=1 Tax=Clostridium massiliamazoniense TaxID=1347366 RepID=UPI0006D76F1A|nr:PTS sugar transporter subunit IIB [Clostridium massiliamazoniense]
MKKILLICSAGMSTSLLVTKMQKAAAEQGLELDISATGSGTYKAEAAKADVLLLGPQVRFMMKEVSSAVPNKPIEVIDMRAYGKVDGVAVLAQALKLMK